MADSLGAKANFSTYAARTFAQRHSSTHCPTKHLLLAARKEAVTRQGTRVALNTSVTRGEVRHGARRCHVTVLALLPFSARGAGKPLRVRTVDVDAKDDAFVTRRTVTAVVVKTRVGILATVDIIERSEEQLPFGRPQEAQIKTAVRQARWTFARASDFVTEVAVDAARCDAADPAKVETRGIMFAYRWRVTGGADASAVRELGD
jgi:hypothetical protein